MSQKNSKGFCCRGIRLLASSSILHGLTKWLSFGSLLVLVVLNLTNFDRSSIGNLGPVGFGCVVRDCNDNVVCVICGPLGV